MSRDERRDALIVLARGRSRRMGRPKGLVVLPDDPRPLLARARDPYRGRGWPTVVVTLPELVAAYGAALADGEAPRMVPEAGGGGTARSVFAGWRALADGAAGDPAATHVWVQPVDLPHVRRATVDRLLAASCAEPDRCLRPLYGDEPGHPVVLTAEQLVRWARDHAAWRGDLRELMAAAPPSRPLRHVPVEDAGVRDDIDAPTDVAARQTREDDHDQ